MSRSRTAPAPWISAIVLTLAVAVPATEAFAVDRSVEAAVQEMRYRITTEWDQKDPAKQDEIYREFAGKIEALARDGLSSAEIIAQLKALVLTKQQARDLDRVAAYVAERGLSAKEANALIAKTFEASAPISGASWNPSGDHANRDLVLGILLGTLVVTGIVVGIVACSRSEHCSFEKTSPDLDPGRCTIGSTGDYWCPPPAL